MSTIFLNFIQTISQNINQNNNQYMTLFIPSDFYINAYAKHLNISVEFLLKSNGFYDILANHITYTPLTANKKQRFVSLSNTSFVFDPINMVIDDVRSNIYGIKINKADDVDVNLDSHLDLNLNSTTTNYYIEGILIQNQSPFSFLEELPKDPFQHLLTVGEFHSKDIYQICNISKTISQKCTDDVYRRLLQKLKIPIDPNLSLKDQYENYAKNPFVWMVYRYPNNAWNWTLIGRNPSVTEYLILAAIDLPKNNVYFEIAIASNPNLDWNFIKTTFDMSKWPFYLQSKNPNITYEIIKNEPQYAWDWENFMTNPSLTLDIINKYKQEKWDWRQLSHNPNLTLEFINRNIDKSWDWFALSSNPIITWKFVEKNKQIKWYWDGLAKNPTIHKDKPNLWLEQFEKELYPSYYKLSEHPYVTWEFIQKNQNKMHSNRDWSFETLSKNLTIPLNVIFSNLELGWDWSAVSERKDVTFEIVLSNLDLPWDWHYISAKPEINWQIVESNPKLAWSYFGLSLNPSITFDDIQSNIDRKWSWNRLTEKPF